MSKVAITEQYLEDIADAIREKTGLSDTYFPSEMATAILSISGGGGITPTGTIEITENGTYNVTQYASADVDVQTGTTINNQTKTGINPSTSSQTITYDNGYTGLESVQINAMPSGTEGTPTATKGSVSNHSVTVTPSVTNSAGYISGGTHTGTGVSVSASELVSGTKSITSNGTGIDVTNYANVNVNVSGGASTCTITLSYNSSTGKWEPDKTWSEMSSTYLNASLVFNCDVSTDEALAEGGWGDENIEYYVYYLIEDDGLFYIYNSSYRWNSNGITLIDSQNYEILSTEDITITPTESEQEISPNYSSGYNGYEFITVNPISSTYVGSSITRRDSTDLTTSGATVTVPSGYYASAATKTISNGSATASATKGTVTNHSITVTPSVTRTAGYITAGSANGTAVTVSASELVSGTYTVDSSGTKDVTNYASASVTAGTAGTPSASKGTVSNHSVSVTPSVTNTTGWITGSTKTGTAVSVSASELVSGNLPINQNGNNIDVTNYATVSVNVSGGGGSSMIVATATKTLSSAASSIQFTGLSGEPTSFVITSSADQTTGGTKVIAVVYDGTSCLGIDLTTQATNDTGFSQSYSSGTLTITATTASFQANEYKLVYSYGGSASNIGTEDVQVGSGATSITFTGLSDEPDYFSCIFKSTFSTSSGYQRVMAVVYDGTSTYGNALDSSAKALTSWSYTYNNGSLTLSSIGTNNGGYFHQPGYYQLTYGIGGTVEPTEIEVEPLSVTQNGTYTAPTGKAYSPVTVSVSGGGGVNVKTTTWTNSSTSTTSHTFSDLSGTPKAAFLRCTAQLTRSSSNTYYYIADIFWDGTNAYGNYHLRSNGSYNNVASNASPGFTVTTGTNSITFTSGASSRSSAPGTFYNSTYELTYIY